MEKKEYEVKAADTGPSETTVALSESVKVPQCRNQEIGMKRWGI